LKNFKKFLNSKWTANFPENKEKHFVVEKVDLNEKDSQIVEIVYLRAVYTNKLYSYDPVELENSDKWTKGWL
jgi:tryptophan-rich hypothetical protein